MATDPVPIRLFLSYARADDEEFGFVAPFTSKLKALIKAKTGRALDVFVDRDSIGWGENWRERLEQSVQGATILIPLMSATYLERPACREEFLAFHSKAKVLGVTELLLPVLLFKSPLFNPDNPDEVARIAEERQYVCIEQALLAGYESAAWTSQLADLAEKLIEALDRAEAALVEDSVVQSKDGPDPDFPVPEGGATGDVGVEEDEVSGLAEYMVDIDAGVREMTEAAEALEPILGALGAAPNEVGELQGDPSPRQLQVWTVRLASVLEQPALELEREGHRMFAAAKNVDEALSGIKTLSIEIDASGSENPIKAGLASMLSGFGDLDEVEGSMTELLTVLKPAETFSAPLRKALRPARRGVTSVRDTLQLVRSWQGMLDDGN